MGNVAISRAIEVAEHNGCYEGDQLIVFDALQNDRYYGVRLEVGPAATAVGGWCGLCRDGVGTACSTWSPDSREAAVQGALDGYLDILNRR